MGKNAHIKSYDFHPPDEELTFFPTSASKAAVVTRLLEARWLTRASALGAARSADARTLSVDAALGKRYDERVAVRWDTALGMPTGFVWRRRHREVDELVASWVVEAYWWDELRRVSRSYWRVSAQEAVFDLYFDRIQKRWFMGAGMD